MTSTPAKPAPTPTPVQPRILFGLTCGFFAAACYGIANICQRFVATERTDIAWAIFVCSFKLLPLLIMGVVGLTWAMAKGRPIRTTRKIILTMAFAGLVMQWPGNVAVQLGMSYCGLAMAIPICFAFILISGSLFGKWLLGEEISSRAVLSQGVLVLATTLLTLGAPQACDSVSGGSSMMNIAIGISASILSGIAFGYCGVAMREAVKDNGSICASMTSLALAGVVSCGVVSFFMMTPGEVNGISRFSWGAILGVGGFTGIAYIFISLAFVHLSVIQCNIVNATQIALAAIGGVLVFHEPATIWLQIGTALNIVGLLSMDRSGSDDSMPAQDAETWPDHPESVLVHSGAEVV